MHTHELERSNKEDKQKSVLKDCYDNGTTIVQGLKRHSSFRSNALLCFHGFYDCNRSYDYEDIKRIFHILPIQIENKRNIFQRVLVGG
jgi:hypothetical protein